MVKHIKKSYKKDGKLTDDEKSIAYATAWKNYNSESAVLDANTKISQDEKKKKKEAELKRLLKHAIAVKKGHAESFEIDKTAHKTAQKKTKMRNLAKGNTNPHEKAAAEKKAGGPKLYGEEQMTYKTYQEMVDAGWEMTGEGIWWPPQPETVTEKLSFAMFKKKAAEKKPQKAMDAGALAKRKLARKVHARYVSGSEDNVPDDIRDHKEFNT